MIHEIYTRSQNDPYYNPNALEHTDEVEAILSEIRMILGTRRGDVLGDYKFGTNIEDLIFTRNIHKDRIQNIINEHIINYIKDFKNYKITSDITFYKMPNGTDAGLIDIYINKVKVQGFLIS